VAAIPGGSRVYVTHLVAGPAGSAGVHVIDAATTTVIATIPLTQPGDLAVSPDGSRVYVTAAGAYNTGAVSVVATATNRVVATIPVTGASGVAVSPDGGKVYVSGNPVSVIETATNRVVATIPVSATGAVAVAQDASKVYVADPTVGSVYVIETTTNAVTATIPFVYGPFDLTVSPDGSKVYVAGLPPGQPNAGLSVIDTATNTVTTLISGLNSALGVAVTSDGGGVYFADEGSDTVWIFDLVTNAVSALVHTGAFDDPFFVAIPPPLVFAGTPGTASCIRHSVSALVRGFGGPNVAAVTLGFPSISALQNAVLAYCDGSDQVASTLR
jgi:YVTN family beta-propeller protein